MTRKDLIIKEEMLRKIHQKTKTSANVRNVENYDITVMNVKKRKRHLFYGDKIKKMI